MSRRLKTFLIILFGLIGIAIILTVVAVITVRRPWPDTEGVVQLPNIDAPVEIYRDSYGIPHIYASTEHDLFFAQGYVHAQDRFLANGVLAQDRIRTPLRGPW